MRPLLLTALALTTLACSTVPARVSATPMTVRAPADQLLVEARALEASDELLRDFRLAGHTLEPHRYIELDPVILNHWVVRGAPDHVVVQSAPRLIVGGAALSNGAGNFGVWVTWHDGVMRLESRSSTPGKVFAEAGQEVVLDDAQRDRLFAYYAPEIESLVMIAVRSI